MGDEDKKLKNAPEPQSGFPQKKIVYGIIAIAVVILAVVVIAKFGYNVDLLNPASGEMSLVGRQTTVAKSTADHQAYSANFTTTTTNAQVGIEKSIISRDPYYSDLENCGSAGNKCPAVFNGNATCSAGKCGFTCNTNYGDCNKNPSDGCEVYLVNDNYNCGSCDYTCGVGTGCIAFRCQEIGYNVYGVVGGSASDSEENTMGDTIMLIRK